MPPDDGCRFDEHHGVEDLRPDPVKPHPEQPIRGEKLNPTFAMAPQDGHLMPKGDQLEFQAGAATKAEREKRDKGRNDRGHAHHGTAEAQKSLGFLCVSEFCARTGSPGATLCR